MQENNREFSILKERILKYLDLKGVSKYECYQKTGITNGVFSQKNGLSEDNILRFLSYYKDLSQEWLLTGEGSMLKSDTYNNVPVPSPETPKHLIPFYDDVQSIGGTNELVANMDGVSEPAEYIDAGDWFKQATSAMRHYGDSMVEFPSGCILALKEVCNMELVVWGRNYVVETDEYRITKRIQKGKTEKYIVAYSSNKETYPDGRLIHEPIDIPKKMIRSLSLVLGYVVKQSSSGKVYINGKNNEKIP